MWCVVQVGRVGPAASFSSGEMGRGGGPGTLKQTEAAPAMPRWRHNPPLKKGKKSGFANKQHIATTKCDPFFLFSLSSCVYLLDAMPARSPRSCACSLPSTTRRQPNALTRRFNAFYIPLFLITHTNTRGRTPSASATSTYLSAALSYQTLPIASNKPIHNQPRYIPLHLSASFSYETKRLGPQCAVMFLARLARLLSAWPLRCTGYPPGGDVETRVCVWMGGVGK